MISLLKSSFIFLIGVTLAANTVHGNTGNYQTCSSDPQLEGRLSKKKKLKTFTADFWKVVESNIPKYPASLKDKGIVVGDFHFANVGLYFDESTDRARLTLNDLDDSGSNYLIGDLLKYLLYLSSLKRQVDPSAVINSYVNGLNRAEVEIPLEIKKLLAMKSYDFFKESAKFAAKKRLEADQFNYSDLGLEEKRVFEEFEKLSVFRNLTAVQKWHQVNTSGSSMGMSRYNFVATSRNTGVDGVLEFKQLNCSAVGPKDRQDLKTEYQKVVQYLNRLYKIEEKNSFLSRQHVLFMNGSFFLLREKSSNLCKDLEIEGYKGAKLQKYSEFFAHYLGFIHSGSATQAYKEAVAQQVKWILDELKPLEKEFLKRLVDDD